MKRILILAGLLLAQLSFGQALWRNAWSTNVPPMPVTGLNNLSVSNFNSGTGWLFYAVGPKTVARLGDVTNVVNAIGGSGGGDSNAFYLVLKTTNSLPNAYRLLSDMATILMQTNASDIIFAVSTAISNWGRFSTNVISDAASNAAMSLMVWTNAAGFIFPAGSTLSNTAAIAIRTNDGSIFMGRNEYLDTQLDVDYPLITYQGILASNDANRFEFDFAVFDNPSSYNLSSIFNAHVVANPDADPRALTTVSLYAKDTNVSTSAYILQFVASPGSGQSPITWQVGSANLFTLGHDGSLTVGGPVTNSTLSPSKLVSTGTGTNLTSSAYSDTDISNLQGATNGLNTAVSNLQNATNQFGNTNRFIASDSGKGTNNVLRQQTNSMITGATVPPLLVQNTNTLPVFQVDTNSQGVLHLGTNSTGWLTASNNASLTNSSLQSGNNAPSIYIGPGGNVGIGTNAPASPLSVSGNIEARGYQFLVGTDNNDGVFSDLSVVLGDSTSDGYRIRNEFTLSAVGTDNNAWFKAANSSAAANPFRLWFSGGSRSSSYAATVASNLPTIFCRTSSPPLISILSGSNTLCNFALNTTNPLATFHGSNYFPQVAFRFDQQSTTNDIFQAYNNNTLVAAVTTNSTMSLAYKLINNTTAPTAANIGANNGWFQTSNNVLYYFSTTDGSSLTTTKIAP